MGKTPPEVNRAIQVISFTTDPLTEGAANNFSAHNHYRSEPSCRDMFKTPFLKHGRLGLVTESKYHEGAERA